MDAIGTVLNIVILIGKSNPTIISIIYIFDELMYEMFVRCGLLSIELDEIF